MPIHRFSRDRRNPGRRRRTTVAAIESLETRLLFSILGQQIFPSDNPWNQNIANAPVASNSAAIISHIGSSIRVHPDWGADSSSNGDSPLYGIPINIVHGDTTAKVNVIIDNYPGQSDIEPVPIPANAVIEGDYQNGPNNNGGGYNPGQRGDSHLIIWDEDNNIAYELYGVTRPSDPTIFPNTDGVELPHTDDQWHAAQETVWNMNTNTFQTLGNTSADAAGLSILAGLVQPAEALPVSQGGQGQIDHALRMTLPFGDVSPQYIYPASHIVSTDQGSDNVPFGTRFRLANNPTVDALIAAMPPESQVIATAMQQYGLIVADIGSAMFVTGTSASVNASNQINLTWNMNDIFASNGLETLTAGDFQVVNLTPIVTGLSKTSASPGSTVIVNGQNFSGAAGQITVFFGNTPGTNVDVLSDTQISVTVPSGTGTVDVTVQSGVNETDTVSDNPDANVNAPIWGYGTSANTSADQFTFAHPTVKPTITVTGASVVYNGQPHAATVTVSGTVLGDLLPAGTTVVTYLLGSYNSTSAPINAGMYAVHVTFTSSDANYSNATAAGTITIKKAAPTVTATGTVNYNGQPQAATPSVKGVGTADPTPTGTFTLTYSGNGYKTSTTPPTNVGTYNVAANFLSSDPNYTSANGTGSLTIQPAITIGPARTIKALQNISTGSVQLATFTVKTNQTFTPANFVGSINWGDGSPLTTATILTSGTLVEVFGTHTYTTSGQYKPIVTLTYAGTYKATATPAPTVNVGTDVSGDIKSTQTTPTKILNSQSKYYGLYHSTLTVTNSSSSPLNGSFEFALSGLASQSPSVQLAYATIQIGSTTETLPISTDSAGDPIIFLSSSLLAHLPAGKSITVYLYFSNPSASLISYSLKAFTDPFDS